MAKKQPEQSKEFSRLELIKQIEKERGSEEVEVEKSIPSQENVLELSKKYYEEHKESLLKKYKGRYIAILNNKVIGSDKDFSRLAQRVYNKYGYQTIYMPFVNTREKVVRVPSPRIKIL